MLVFVFLLYQDDMSHNTQITEKQISRCTDGGWRHSFAIRVWPWAIHTVECYTGSVSVRHDMSHGICAVSFKWMYHFTSLHSTVVYSTNIPHLICRKSSGTHTETGPVKYICVAKKSKTLRKVSADRDY